MKRKRSIFSAGGSISVFLSKVGEVYLFGRDLYTKEKFRELKQKPLTPLELPEKIESVYSHLGCNIFLLGVSGKVYSVGDNAFGERFFMADEKKFINKISFFNDKKVTHIAAGEYSTFISIRQDKSDQVYCSGYNNGGLSIGNIKDKYSATRIPILSGMRIIGIYAGYGHNVFLTRENGSKKNTVFVSGFNCNGQLGLGNTERQTLAKRVPFFLRNNFNITSASCGSYHTLFLEGNSGKVFSCGCNQNGECAYPPQPTDTDVTIPVCVLKDYFICKVEATHYSSFFLCKNGDLIACGKEIRINLNHEPGFFFPLEKTRKGGLKLVYKIISPIPNSPIKSFSCGDGFCLVTTYAKPRRVFGIGNNSNYQLTFKKSNDCVVGDTKSRYISKWREIEIDVDVEDEWEKYTCLFQKKMLKNNKYVDMVIKSNS